MVLMVKNPPAIAGNIRDMGLIPGLGLIPSAQRLDWAAKQPLGNSALGALFADKELCLRVPADFQCQSQSCARSFFGKKDVVYTENGRI